MITFVYYDAVLKVDKEYEYDGVVTATEAVMLWEKSGLGFRKIFEALDDGVPMAVIAWRWMLARRAGEVVTWDAMMKTNITDFKGVKPQEEPAFPTEEDLEQKENPTEPTAPTSMSGTNPESDTEATT